MSRVIRAFVAAPRFDRNTPPGSAEGWPRVSVITPSFNQAAFLEKTLLSIHNQDYPNLEHIIIDGGSTDGSVDIIRKYEKRLAYWRTGSDGGQSDAINMGAARATGRYMMWINSDDLLLPGALHTMARAVERHPASELIYGNQVEVDRDDVVIKRLYTIDFDILDFLYEINIIVHQQSAMWSTDLFRRVGGLKLYRYAMDYDLIYRMHTAGARFRRIEEFLSAFRVHSQGLTGSGEVARRRGKEVDASFKDYFDRDRSLFDKTFMRSLYKGKRFLSEPRCLSAALEHRLGRMFSRG